MKIQWLTHWDDIFDTEFQKRWRYWLESDPYGHVFFSPELVTAWLETYWPLRKLTPRFLLIEENDSCLFWPLVLWQQNWKNAFCRRLIPVGFSDFDYAEPIVNGNRELLLSEAFRQIRLYNGFDQVDIPGLLEYPEAQLEAQICPFCELKNYVDGADFLNQTRKSLREDVRRQFNRAKEQGTLQFESCNLEMATAEFPDFLDAHTARWPHAYKAPLFHKNLLKHGLPAGQVHFDRLTLNGVSIAWHLGFHAKQRFYYYMPANRVEYQKISPGKLLLYCLLERSIAEGDQIFDHLRGDENYKAGWTNQAQKLWKFHARSTSFSGQMKFLFNNKVRPLLKRF